MIESKTYADGTTVTGTAPLPNVSPTALPPHQQRVIAERDELSFKLGKLLEFTRTTTFGDLDAPEKSRLNRQVQHMSDYRGVLNERIDAFQRPAKTSGTVELDNIGNDKSNWEGAATALSVAKVRGEIPHEMLVHAICGAGIANDELYPEYEARRMVETDEYGYYHWNRVKLRELPDDVLRALYVRVSSPDATPDDKSNW